MTHNVLVTGINGFVGHHLARTLTDLGATVTGVGTDAAPSQALEKVMSNYVQADLTDAETVKQAVNLTAIDAVIHLAGLANVGQSFSEPARFLSANAAMSINLLQHALDSKSTARFVIISSGAVYDSKQQMPINESGQLTHGSPYAVSKLAVEMMNDYYRSRGLDVITMRPFNHIGPGQGQGFIVPDLLAKLRTAQSDGSVVSVGDLTTARDYTDVRDVAAAYASVALSDAAPKESVYNVCSGKSRTGQEILDTLIKALEFASPPTIEVDQSLLRPNDARNIVGDNNRLSGEFGWQPKYNLDDTIRDIVTA
jgi:GDP-4-dehydro-6-deoxy-D-mannose reductase